MRSPLEDKPEILEKIGLFVVLFNLIDSRLGHEFYYIINQDDTNRRPILSYLESLGINAKLNMLRSILGEKLYNNITKANDFRIFIAHGSYGLNSGTQEISISKMKRNTGKYIQYDLSEAILDEQIQNEREILSLLHKLILERMSKKSD